MIEALMLVSLGFFAASLLALLVAPAAWARAVRLTSHRIRNSLPINETEIRAEKDQLRATHAVVVHQLEKKIERAEMSAARQRVELNRREARISELDDERVKLTAQRDENRNARHVLAQTLNERLPRAEDRLRETRELLKARDTQVAKFVKAATAQHIALAEAENQIRQQDEEARRLQAALTARQYAVRQKVPTEGLEQTVALQSEVRELRERTATQARLIERIQEAERTQMQDSQAADVARSIEEGAFATAEPEDHTNGNGADNAPEGFAARFNRWRVALNREKETTSRLRTELANAHDRAAKLSAHYRQELRGLSQSGAVYAAPSEPIDSLISPEPVSKPSEEHSSLMDRAGVTTSKQGVGANGGEKSNSNGSSERETTNGDGATDTARSSRNRREKPKSQEAILGAPKDESSEVRRGSLTERIKRQDKDADDEDTLAQDPEATKMPPQVPAKVGTLLQRLKGMEDA